MWYYRLTQKGRLRNNLGKIECCLMAKFWDHNIVITTYALGFFFILSSFPFRFLCSTILGFIFCFESIALWRTCICDRMVKWIPFLPQNRAAYVCTGGPSILLTLEVFTQALCFIARAESWHLSFNFFKMPDIVSVHLTADFCVLHICWYKHIHLFRIKLFYTWEQCSTLLICYYL